ncbi:hypothetical protein [Acetomicrobium sp.]
MKIAKENGAVVVKAGKWTVRIANDEQAIAAQLAAARWMKRGKRHGG